MELLYRLGISTCIERPNILYSLKRNDQMYVKVIVGKTWVLINIPTGEYRGFINTRPRVRTRAHILTSKNITPTMNHLKSNITPKSTSDSIR